MTAGRVVPCGAARLGALRFNGEDKAVLKPSRFKTLLALGLMAGLAAPLQAQPGEWVNHVVQIAPPAQPPAISLPVTLPRDNPAHEGWAMQQPNQSMVYNVVKPTLLPMPGSLPADKEAPAVILVPGGGFLYLAMENEGFHVADRLDKQGVRVFILKYRTLPVPDSYPAFIDVLKGTFQSGATRGKITDDVPFAVADTQAAIRMVRAHAKEWHIDPAKIGILGFSAGAITALTATQANLPDARPDFVGLIYGPTQSGPVPPKAPPLFAAIAADDRFFGKQDLGLLHDWRLSGASVEFHLFSAGGHGFASHPNGTTSDMWFDEFALWLKDMKITAPN